MSLLDFLAGHPLAVVDPGQPWFAGMPASPSHPGFRSSLSLRHGDVERADGMSGAHEVMTTGGHVGTHVDALCHVAVHGMVFDGRPARVVYGRYAVGGIEEFPLAVRRAVLVDVPALRGLDRLGPGDAVTAADLELSEVAIGAGDTVLVRTGWGQLWPDAEAYLGADSGVPGLDRSAANWLAQRQVSLAGSDTVALEQILPATGHSQLPCTGSCSPSTGST